MERSNSSCMAFTTMSFCAQRGTAAARTQSNMDVRTIRILYLQSEPRFSLVLEGGGKNGRPILRLLLLLHFDLRNEDGGGDGGNRDTTRFRAADPVEDRDVVIGSDNLAEGSQRRADQIHAANQFLATVGVDSIDHQRHDIEGVRYEPSSEGEAAGDVIEVEAEGQALLLHLFDEQFLQIRLHGRGRHFDDEIGLSRHRVESCLSPPMPIGLRKSIDGSAR